MLKLMESSALDRLRKLAVHLEAQMAESNGNAVMHLDNDYGKGTISSFDVVQGLTVWVYSLTFRRDFEVLLHITKHKQVYFSHTLSGQHYHKIHGMDSSFKKIVKNQNLIVTNHPNIKSTTIIPGGKAIKMCLIFLDKSLLQTYAKPYVPDLQKRLLEVFDKISESNSTRFVGDINLDTAKYAEMVVNNQRTDVAGSLMIDGAVINMLLSQWLDFTKPEKISSRRITGLENKTLLRCTKVAEYVLSNMGKKITVNAICKHLSLSPRKLQAGIKHLYGSSVNKYLVRLRLAHARDLIQSTENSVGEIGKLSGFTSKSYFSKIFHEHYGYFPSDYKKRFRDEGVLFEVGYRSTAAKGITINDVEKIVGQAIQNNGENGITGCLIYSNNTFFQIIEGPKAKVLELYESISADKRHMDIQLVYQGTKYIRNFGLWSMALITERGSLRMTYENRENHVSLNSMIKSFQNSEEVSEAIWGRIRQFVNLSQTTRHNVK